MVGTVVGTVGGSVDRKFVSTVVGKVVRTVVGEVVHIEVRTFVGTVGIKVLKLMFEEWLAQCSEQFSEHW